MSERKELQPVEVVRDAEGYWTHPDLDKASTWGQSECVTRAQFDLFKQQQNIEMQMVCFEDDAPEALLEQYGEGSPDVSGWNPSKPDGDGWFMLSLHDTEDSPICWWIRHKELFIPVDILNQFKHEMISHGYGSFYSFDTFENGNFIDSNTKTLFVGWRVANAKRTELQAEVDRLQAAQAVPEGYVVVPLEPTNAMLNYGMDHFNGAFIEGGATGITSLEFAYKAMIKAAQEQNQ